MTTGKLSRLPARTEQWADRIRTQLGKSVESIIEVGRLLVKAKADLEHGEWGRLADELLPFDRHTAFKMMAIAEHAVLANVAHGQHLPPAWTTLYELTKVEPKRLAAAFKDGIITPDMTRKDVQALMPVPRRVAEPKTADADVEIVEEGPDDIEDDIEPPNYEGAFLMRADTAAQMAVYSRGPLTANVVSYARKAASAWTALSEHLEARLQEK